MYLEKKLVWFCCSFFLFLDSGALGQNSRLEFFENVQKIKTKMTHDEVQGVLGKPDDVWTKDKDNAITQPSVSEVWCYGTLYHLGFPTLGRIEFDHNGLVFNVIGNLGVPIKSSIDEKRLRILLQMIKDGPTFYGEEFDPYRLIKMTNAFQPLGQEQTFSIFREYHRVLGSGGKEDALFLLVNCLHEMPHPPKTFPIMRVGEPAPNGPAEIDLYPRYPIRFVDDIPLLMVRGFELAGSAPRIEGYLKQFEEKIEWISHPLKINNNEQGKIFDSFEEFKKSKAWYFDESDSNPMSRMLRTQIGRFIHNRNVDNKKNVGGKPKK